MKKWLGMVVAVCVGTSSAQAQDMGNTGVRKGAIELGAAGGLSVPFGDYADAANLSGTGSILVGYYVSPQFSFGWDAGGHWHGPTDEAKQAQADALGQADAELSFKLWRIVTPYVRYQFKADKFSPFVSGLTGLYLQQVKWTQITVGGNVSQDVSRVFYGVGGGLGVQYNTDESVALFLEGRAHIAMRDGFSPLTFAEARIGAAFLL